MKNSIVGQTAEHIADVAGVELRSSGRLTPAENCCGVMPLLLSTVVICGFHLVWNTIVIFGTDADHGITIKGVHISASMQIGNAVWSLIGVPVIICAGVGAVYRIERLIRTYCYYMCATLALSIFWTVQWIATGGVCGQIAPQGARALGSSIVCGGVIAMVAFWGLWVVWFWLYLIFIVWSTAEEVKLGEYPDVTFFMTMLRAQQAASEVEPLTGMQPWRHEAASA